MDKVIVQQNREFQVAFRAQSEEEEELHEVAHIYELSPYTMMLASLGVCTTIVMHTYAQHHGVDLDLVQATVTYHRKEHEDAQGDQPFDEWIEEELSMEGDLTDAQYERLGHVGHACSIRKMLESGIEVRSRLAEPA